MAPPEIPATFETFQAELARLVAQFDRQYPTYTAPDYNEQTLRADFLDAFFRALGWDVGNQKGLIHTEREVDIEVRTHLSGRQTRADYVFRLNRTERFTCEAKKPAEALHNRHVFQAKRDAFARGVPLAILSDFEEMKLFIVGARPHLDDPHTGEYKVLHFRQYNDAARELWDLLGYVSIKAGSIDRLIDSLPKRPLRLKGRQGYLIKPDRTRALDADFLNFLDDVRQQLGSDLLKHNDRADLLEGHRLNEAAQHIIDRLVFLRICEDRGIDTGTLLQTLFDGWYRQQPDPAKPKLRKPGKQTHLRFDGALEEEPPSGQGPRARAEGGLYRELTDHIRALDQRPPSYKPFFNGQLFKPHFSEDLVVGDEWLANFLLDLVDDDTGYNFADIKVEILGDAYERFLGKILRPQGRGATIEEKPEVRKAGGVYYTPRYITDYIVEQTVGRLLEGKTPKQVERLKIVDPACGSGSFLLRAYERVMEHHLRWFTANPDKQRKEDCYVDAANNVRLTTALKRRILEHNIYGVDIDAQAVEVTQLSLYLKMLEGENRETLRNQTELFRDQPLLPPLDKNIKCFNSLIASDFSLDPAELVRVNAGDWDVQFAEIMNAGGFDAVIGNPPYIQLSMEEFRDKAANEYLKERFNMSGGRMNTFTFFLERAREITRESGAFGYIVPNTILTQEYYEEPRKRLATASSLDFIVQPKGQIFADAVVETVILTAQRIVPGKMHQVAFGDLLETGLENSHRVPQSEFARNYKWSFVVPADPALQALKDKLNSLPEKFGDSLNINQAIALKHDRNACLTDSKLTAKHHEILDGRHIARYFTGSSPSYFKFDLAKIHSCKREDIFQLDEKIFFRRVGDSLIGSLDCNQKYALNTLVVISPTSTTKHSTKFVLGLFNSRLLNFYYTTFLKSSKKVFSEIQARQVAQLPLPRIDCQSPQGNQLHDRLAALVDKMLTLTPALRTAKSAAEKTTIQNALTKTDREIDQLVYQLYGLTPQEITLVEGAGNPAPAGPAD